MEKGETNILDHLFNVLQLFSIHYHYILSYLHLPVTCILCSIPIVHSNTAHQYLRNVSQKQQLLSWPSPDCNTVCESRKETGFWHFPLCIKSAASSSWPLTHHSQCEGKSSLFCGLVPMCQTCCLMLLSFKDVYSKLCCQTDSEMPLLRFWREKRSVDEMICNPQVAASSKEKYKVVATVRSKCFNALFKVAVAILCGVSLTGFGCDVVSC